MHAGTRPGPQRPSGRGPASRLPVAFLLLALVSVLWSLPAGAAPPDRPVVDVVEVSGFIDPVVVDFVEHSLASAEKAGAEAFVIQLNSRGSLVSKAELDALLFRLFHQSKVPV